MTLHLTLDIHNIAPIEVHTITLMCAVLQILTLLEAMNLAQYQDNFVKEQVDGEILADCDEGMLEVDLHITSAIHRNRLMKIITGKHSAQYFTTTSEERLYSTLDRSYRKKGVTNV